MSFRITGIDPKPFLSLYGLDEAQLDKRGVIRVVASNDTGYPERIELRNARRGEALLLLNHTHQPAQSPYRSSHAIFIREGATEACEVSDEVPEVLRTRTLSLRGFDEREHIASAVLVEGSVLDDAIERMFAMSSVRYAHVHYAAYGCYAARIDRS
ncbi:hypothetical protein BJI69_17130 [Luteibacter rhizovicinus DSM 16549]|uniref:Uncharacterized protein n=1 Tax=Luteibacter rhizovicinus DSM 16549 TaxID=1440763 RepID=A0A0G9GZ44_9GAMM|nr:DUF1203 domain-containing protein [Luteibacter rhizovicinus]APG05458.1 hypothetical protein BJI69_17130 [Luteibacter rhizovicinus DSM 16549]KLD62521.1 hypothetical protein Y883_20475 [Luteibacter rhizovicinus DSM 16549]